MAAPTRLPSGRSRSGHPPLPAARDGGLTSCGERFYTLNVQGQPPAAPRLAGVGGFIPAHAGAAPGPWRWGGPERVHPCPCRGGWVRARKRTTWLGSSLPMQGRPRSGPLEAPPRGFIPAHAGAAPDRRSDGGRGGGHPCPCRGGTYCGVTSRSRAGSSLPMQGRLEVAVEAHAGAGFIPAHAGAACWPAPPPACCRVHPCPCRGGFIRPDRHDPMEGSSLPMQGRQWCATFTRASVGFIPAHAGAAGGGR